MQQTCASPKTYHLSCAIEHAFGILSNFGFLAEIKSMRLVGHRPHGKLQFRYQLPEMHVQLWSAVTVAHDAT